MIIILLSVTVYSQDEKSLINKKNLLLEEIELSKKTLNSAKNQKIISTKELQALNAYIKVRTNLKNTILQQRDSIELYKQEILNKIQINNKKISTIKESYKSLIREIYFNDFGINLISFIFSTSSFKDKIGKYVYYKEKEQHRQNLLYELDYLQNELISFNNNLNENINLKDTLLKEFNLEKSVFMHCVSSYPCPANKVNLPRLEYVKKFTRNYGYSGHFEGIDDAIAAICHGATYIEKHFTIDKDLEGRDNKFALLPEDFVNLSSFRNNYEQMQINQGIDLQESEQDTYNNYRGRWSK